MQTMTKLAITINNATALMLGIQRLTGSDAGNSTPRPAAPSAAPTSSPIECVSVPK